MATRDLSGRLVEHRADDGFRIVTQTHASDEERRRREEFHELYTRSPLPAGEQLANIGLFLNRQTFSRMMFLHDMYRNVLDVHGVVLEFGVRWGRDLVSFATFRAMYEPYNYLRRIVGFDTFAGFPSVHGLDAGGLARPGDYSVTAGYEEYLAAVLAHHEADSPLPHIRKFELVKGDAAETIGRYLERHPETIVALAYFDMDIYEPTKACLDAIRPHLTRGTVIGFDEACYAEFPGETRALMESFDLRRCRLHRSPYAPNPSYMILD